MGAILVECPFCSRGRGIPPFTCAHCRTAIPGRLTPRTARKSGGARAASGPVIPMTRDQFDRWIEVLRPAFVGYLYNNWSTIRKRMLQEEIAHEAIAALYDSKAWTNFRGDPGNRQAVLTWCLGYVKNTARKFTQPAERTGVKRTALRFTGQAGRTMPLSRRTHGSTPRLPEGSQFRRDPVGLGDARRGIRADRDTAPDACASRIHARVGGRRARCRRDAERERHGPAALGRADAGTPGG
jgi:hypothetical protein